MFSPSALVTSAAACAALLSGCGGGNPAPSPTPAPAPSPTPAPAPMPSKTALLVIDVQDCFLPGGSLAVPADHIIEPINTLTSNCAWDDVVYTQDFHPMNHISFGSTHGLAPFSGELPVMCIKPESGMTQDAACCPTIYINSTAVDCETQLCPPAGWDYDANNSAIVSGNAACSECASNPDGCYHTVQAMWTDHCVQTGDSTFPSSLNMGNNPKIVQKGGNVYVDAYSGFKDNSKQVETELHQELQNAEITDLVVVGIATDVCVKESVIDAIGYGYRVTVLADATAAVLGNQENFDAAIAEMQSAGASVLPSWTDLLAACPPAMDKLSTFHF